MNLIKTIFVAGSLLFTSLAWAAVNINTADAETLQQLNGIGEAKAQAIIEHRQTHGAFKSAEELAEVKGIGENTVESNKAEIVVE